MKRKRKKEIFSNNEHRAQYFTDDHFLDPFSLFIKNINSDFIVIK